MGKEKNQNKIIHKCSIKKKKIEKNLKQIIDNNKIYLKKLIDKKQIIVEFPIMYKYSDYSYNNKGQQKISLPIFRQDKLDYTPGFCLHDQLTLEFCKQQLMLHQYRISSQLAMIDCQNIKQPKPSSRNSYCTICKTKFQDYKEHIQLPQHINKMKKSQYNQFIKQMCRQKQIMRSFISGQKSQDTNPQQRNQIQELLKSQRRSSCVNSKQALYQKIKEQCINRTKSSLSRNVIEGQEIFDVLALTCFELHYLIGS